jgi:hypothetical protein
MITLTVPHIEKDGKLFKGLLDRYLCSMMKKAPAGASATWFLEFQKRGAPHVHILTNFIVPMEWTDRVWPELWRPRLEELFSPDAAVETFLHMQQASTRTEALRSQGVMKAYAIKYSTKADQKSVPSEYAHVGRFWGVRGDRSRVVAATYRRRVYTGLDGLPDTFSRLYWSLIMDLCLNATDIRVVHWQKGIGISVYNADASFILKLKAVLNEFDFEEAALCLKNATTSLIAQQYATLTHGQ